MESPNRYIVLAPIPDRLSWVHSGEWGDVAHIAPTPHGCESTTICGAILMTDHGERAELVRPCIGCLHTLRDLMCSGPGDANARV
jgi:hypothetical protein